MWDFGTGIKRWLISEYEKTEFGQGVDLRGKWKGLKADKRDVKVECPKCKHNFCALISNPMTVEISLKRKGRERDSNKTSIVVYGTACNRCKTKFRFKAIYDAFYYPKLGEY